MNVFNCQNLYKNAPPSAPSSTGLHLILQRSSPQSQSHIDFQQWMDTKQSTTHIAVSLSTSFAFTPSPSSSATIKYLQRKTLTECRKRS